MGIDQSVTFAEVSVPTWSAVRDFLTGLGYTVQIRMIDGELAFPDEEPPEPWRELRLGAPEGMVTLRRSGGDITFVTWGNADAGLRQAWNALTWAFAQVGNGTVPTATGRIDAAMFRRSAELPAALQAKAGSDSANR